MTKQQTVELLQKQLPGFYSVEQVIEMINAIEEPATPAVLSPADIFFQSFMGPLRDRIEEAVENAVEGLSAEEVVDFDSAEMELQYGNQVVLDSINVNSNFSAEISQQVLDAIEDYLTSRPEGDSGEAQN